MIKLFNDSKKNRVNVFTYVGRNLNETHKLKSYWLWLNFLHQKPNHPLIYPLSASFCQSFNRRLHLDLLNIYIVIANDTGAMQNFRIPRRELDLLSTMITPLRNRKGVELKNSH